MTQDFGMTKAGQPRKRPARPYEGRPTHYRPELCDKVIEGVDKWGLISLRAIAAYIEIPSQLLYDYAEKYPEFKQALDYARDRAVMFWETKGRDPSSGYSPPVALHALRNSDPEAHDEFLRRGKAGVVSAPVVHVHTSPAPAPKDDADGK